MRGRVGVARWPVCTSKTRARASPILHLPGRPFLRCPRPRPPFGLWLPQLDRARHTHHDAREVVAQFNRLIEESKQLMGSMFDRYIESTDGRDSMTRLLNRRSLAAVAQREIERARRPHSAFARLVSETDGFDALSGALGLDGTDAVMAGVAEGLLVAASADAALKSAQASGTNRCVVDA